METERLPLSIHDIEGISRYFNQHIAKPWWKPWVGSIEAIVEGLEVPHLKAGTVGRAFRSLTFASRIKHATYWWCYPYEADGQGLKRLTRILSAVGLDHEDRGRISDIIAGECHQLVLEHPDLQRWLRSRISLLRFCTRAKSSRELPDALYLLRNQYTRVLNHAWSAPRRAFAEVKELVETALSGAAQSVAHELKHGEQRIVATASLMVPIQRNSLERTVALLSRTSPEAPTRHQRSQELWNGLVKDGNTTLLIVVAQTGNDDHTGFWVPHVANEALCYLPGAPHAIARGSGDVVFTRDLPKLTSRGFAPELHRKWTRYVEDHVGGAHFVSVPLLVPRTNSANGGSSVVTGVLNVNAFPGTEADWWFRALHEEWLSRAQKSAAPFIEVAVNAILIKYALFGAQILLDTGDEGWNVLPGSPVQGDGDSGRIFSLLEKKEEE